MKNHLVILVLMIVVITSIACSTNKRAVSVVPKKPRYDYVKVHEPKTTSPAIPLVEEGIARLKDGQNEEAEWQFEEAINLDADFGPAYYWLARARYRLDEVSDAIDLLDKAKTLLKHSRIWLERIQRFREFLKNRLDLER